MNRITAFLLLIVFLFPFSVSAEDGYWEYTFRPGDSIWKIAEKYTTSVDNWYEIQKINSIRQGPDRKIRPGTRIVVPVSMLKLQPVPALVIAVTGDVDVLRNNGEKVKAKVDMELYSGDQVITKSKQRIRLQFADKSELQIRPESNVMLDKLSHHKQVGMVDTRIRLNSGGVNTWVEKQNPDSHYEITTPAAITAVRGTAFRLSTDSEQISRTEVTDGVVDVSAGNTEKAVNNGYGIVAEKDKPLQEPVKLLPPPAVSIEYIKETDMHIASWLELEGAKHYHYQLSTDADFNMVVVDGVTEHHTLDIKDLSVGTYYLSVRAVDLNLLEGVDSINTFEKQELIIEDDTLWKVMLSVGLIILLL